MNFSLGKKGMLRKPRNQFQQLHPHREVLAPPPAQYADTFDFNDQQHIQMGFGYGSGLPLRVDSCFSSTTMPTQIPVQQQQQQQQPPPQPQLLQQQQQQQQQQKQPDSHSLYENLPEPVVEVVVDNDGQPGDDKEQPMKTPTKFRSSKSPEAAIRNALLESRPRLEKSEGEAIATFCDQPPVGRVAMVKVNRRMEHRLSADCESLVAKSNSTSAVLDNSKKKTLINSSLPSVSNTCSLVGSKINSIQPNGQGPNAPTTNTNGVVVNRYWQKQTTTSNEFLPTAFKPYRKTCSDEKEHQQQQQQQQPRKELEKPKIVENSLSPDTSSADDAVVVAYV